MKQPMNRYVLLLTPLLTSLLAGMPPVQAQEASQDVYLCVNDKGHREYKNTGLTKGCKKVELPGITTVAAPPPPKRGDNQAKRSESSPAEFPKVDGAVQKSRDNDRRRILDDELKSEEGKLSLLKSDYHGGQPERQGNEANYAKYQERVARMKDDIGRVEKNIEALKREIANTK
jgi:hypothetical protein